MSANCFSVWKTSFPGPSTGASTLDPTEGLPSQTLWAITPHIRIDGDATVYSRLLLMMMMNYA